MNAESPLPETLDVTNCDYFSSPIFCPNSLLGPSLRGDDGYAPMTRMAEVGCQFECVSGW